MLLKKKCSTFSEKFTTLRLPIWRKLSATITLIIIVIISVLNFIILNRQKEQLYQQTVKIGMVSLNYFSINARIPLLEENILELNTLIKNATKVEGLLYAIIVDQGQKIKAHSDHRKIGMAFEGFNNVKKVARKGDVIYFNYISPDGKNVLNLTQAIKFKEKKLGEVHVGVSIDFIEQLIQQERSFVLIMTFFSMVFGIVIAVLLSFNFSRPIAKLVLATKEISEGNYRLNVKLDRNDELGTLATAFNHMGDELWAKSLMQKSFGKYVGSEVLKMIMANPERAWLKGRRNEATILFSDIRDFTSYSDKKEPEEVVEALNEYFEIATRVIFEYGGFVDKFIGDAVLGVFGVPVYYKDQAEKALRAAFDMQRQLQESSKNGNKLLASVGISINSGVVVSGNIGSQVKMEYTVIGDTVNMASRLNGMSGPGEVVISKNVYEQLKNIITAAELLPQNIKGKSAPVEIFKALNLKEKNSGNIEQ